MVLPVTLIFLENMIVSAFATCFKMVLSLFAVDWTFLKPVCLGGYKLFPVLLLFSVGFSYCPVRHTTDTEPEAFCASKYVSSRGLGIKWRLVTGNLLSLWRCWTLAFLGRLVAAVGSLLSAFPPHLYWRSELRVHNSLSGLCCSLPQRLRACFPTVPFAKGFLHSISWTPQRSVSSFNKIAANSHLN